MYFLSLVNCAILSILFNVDVSSLLLTDKDLNYDDLASGLKAALQNDKSAFDADRLQKYTGNLLGPRTVCIEIN